MNKFLILALFACVAVVACQDVEDQESQAGLKPADDEEVMGLPENQKSYGEFCLESRDYVFGDIRTTTNSISSRIFNLVFRTAGQIGGDAVKTIEAASGSIAHQMVDPSAPIEPTSDEAEEIVNEARQAIANGQSQPAAFLSGFRAVIGAVSSNLVRRFNSGVESIQTSMNPRLISDALSEACAKVAGYEQELDGKFQEFKKGVAAADDVTFQNVQCVTVRRVSRIAGLCSFAQLARPSVEKVIKG